jgi:hypothetical protein
MEKDKKEGILIQFPESREEELIQPTREKKIKSFSDAFDILGWEVKSKEIAIISFSSKTLDYIALATKKRKVVTEKHKIEFSHIIDLDSLQIESIEKWKSINFQSFFIDERKINKEKLSPNLLDSLLSEIKKNRQDLKNDIERLITLQKYSNYTLIGENIEQLVQEREALSCTLDIFDSSTKLRQEVLSSWIPKSENIAITSEKDEKAILKESISFFDGIERTIQEETTIQHDLLNFDSSMAEEHNGGYSKFTLGDRKLNIFYTNRTALEKAIGIDLIYYNEKYNSFILVQYKLLKKERDVFLYRPDKQMKKELLRMNDFMSKYKNSGSIKGNEEYRLNDDGFIFKFIENKGIKIASSELIKGLYITREYMNFIISPNSPKGERGGTIISTENTPRYLTNSEFTMLMSKGFLGTREIQSHVLTKLIKEYLETGRALLLAIESNSKEKNIEYEY